MTTFIGAYGEMRIHLSKYHGIRRIIGPHTNKYDLLGDPEVTANIYCKSRNRPNADTQNYSTDLR